VVDAFKNIFEDCLHDWNGPNKYKLMKELDTLLIEKSFGVGRDPANPNANLVWWFTDEIMPKIEKASKNQDPMV